ncbi:hypothetical protein OS493_013365 [Desmophyllum pertusum]|uniref:TNFR-Cys domain-containing protein n=1 Tax=Desmophyllum pertusum TaxID=174260 RepID=A0A9W9YGP6_9CNID|nr:hypothetical protein OS493_013365 [Desmophyllum pertusum]
MPTRSRIAQCSLRTSAMAAQTAIFFYSGYGMNGGCIACSSPCTIFQDETITCSTEHDRTCTVKGTILQVLSNSSTGPTKNIPNSTDNTVDFGGTEQPVDPALAIGATPPPDKTPTVKSPILWGIICAAGLVVAITVFLVVRYRRGKGRKPKDDSNVHDDSDVHAGTVNNAAAKDSTLKSKCCYFYWQITAEKLGLLNECRAWEAADNPTEKMLTAYGDKEGSTIKSLIAALRESELTQLANEIEQQFSITAVEGAREPRHIADTVV